MKKLLAACAFGFLVGLLVFAVGREIAFDERSWAQLLSDAFRVVGRLGWVDTTLITGLAAVTAAVFSIRAVGAQISASDAAVQRQIDHASTIEENRSTARRDANRSVMPLTLANLSQYSQANALLLDDLWDKCESGLLPKDTAETAFANLPSGSIAALKELVEVLEEQERFSIRQLLVEIQIESSRLQWVIQTQRRGNIITQSNIESRILGQCAIYARASTFYEFARWQSNSLPRTLTAKDIYDALMLTGAYKAQEHLNEIYKLSESTVWEAPGSGADLLPT